MYPGFKIERKCPSNSVMPGQVVPETIPVVETMALNYKRLFRQYFYEYMEQSIILEGFLKKYPEYEIETTSNLVSLDPAINNVMYAREKCREFAYYHLGVSKNVVGDLEKPFPTRYGNGLEKLESLAKKYKQFLKTVLYEYAEQSMKIRSFLSNYPEHQTFFNSPLEQLDPKHNKNRLSVRTKCNSFAIRKKGWAKGVVNHIENPL